MIVEYERNFKEVETIKEKVDSIIEEAKEQKLPIKQIKLDQHQIKAFMKEVGCCEWYNGVYITGYYRLDKSLTVEQTSTAIESAWGRVKEIVNIDKLSDFATNQ